MLGARYSAELICCVADEIVLALTHLELPRRRTETEEGGLEGDAGE